MANVLSPEELDQKVADLSYEDARSRLVEIVTRLEQGNIPLDEALTMWELGEALARRCELWLDGARERLRAAQTHVANVSASQASAGATAPTGATAPDDKAFTGISVPEGSEAES
ncbi:exodeoxyribonuclease VII small subunit [Trueperella pecoris]|uniref:exodeoxyribonuclease VII small subunit n=1 Tax=Trueperella pecoris TaxID=2733571 RepID=UPI00186B9204|nr:exodeoxyribonuclease VII small subunit [Trueperella pecoris]QOQ38205.1 exodeoxyribonuclease VII small subunit [Trueperella pecoris]QTG75182.1 exodeoxyribonuclease VII small subunit [Trueperella pecoris]